MLNDLPTPHDLTHMLDSDAMVYIAIGAALTVLWLVWKAMAVEVMPQKRLRAVVQRREDLRKALRAENSRREGVLRKDFLQQLALQLKNIPLLASAELKKNLLRAGMRQKEAMTTFSLFKLCMPFALFMLGLFLTSVIGLGGTQPAIKLLILLGMPVFGFMLPDIWLKNAIQKREEVLRKGLPDAFDLLVICAEAGLGLDAALDRVSREMAGSQKILAEEIGLTAVELGFLPDRRAALLGFAERVQLANVRALVNTLVQSEKYGTPLAQALRVLSAEMRDERMMRAEEKAAKLPATLTVPMILFILPTLFIVLLGPAIIKVLDLNKLH